MRHHRVESPIGPLLLAGEEGALSFLSFLAGKSPLVVGPDWEEDPAPFEEVVRQLGEYFEGRRRAFSLPLALSGTPFQKRVYEALREVPYGTTVSYGELAKKIGRPGAARAVGGANRQNPLPIVIPCHRVIGADGGLTGFGGGLAIKRRLLALEGVPLPP